MTANHNQQQLADSAPDANSGTLDPELCRQARLARDPRFDGEFFLAVKTTGIYCRPICPARSPAEKNVTYYRSSVQATQAGFRPCLRCRPESAPDSPAWQGTSTTVQRALALIQQGALNSEPLAHLAERLGVGERYLRKLFQRELGVSPQGIALHRRLLFASKLLAETPIPVTEVAFAAGFGSVRRFNDAVKAHFRLTPQQLRRKRASAADSGGIKLQLHYRPPYDWDGVINFFERHAIAGVESVSSDSYERKLRVAGQAARFRVTPLADRHALQLELYSPDHSSLMPLVARLRRMFDLDANPAAIQAILGKDPVLAPLVDQFPGIRAPGSWSLFESSIRSIVGQQVSTEAARSICSRLAAACSEDPGHLTFPSAQAIAALGDSHFPMPHRRRETLRLLCSAFSTREEELDLAALAALPGVGPWTVAMVAIRGSGDPDAFPPKDLGLKKAWDALPDPRRSPKNRLNDQTALWRPWRAYAANLLWRSLST